MIDWIDCVLELEHDPIPSGHYLLFNAEGEVINHSHCYKRVTGSFDDHLTFRSQGSLDNGKCSHLYFSGNPSKYLQGHNVFGINSIQDLLEGALTSPEVLTDLGLDRASVLKAIPNASLKRVDITESLEFESVEQVRSYIKQISLYAHSRAGKGQLKGNSLYFQKTSRRWSVVLYSKGDEIKKRSFNSTFEFKDFITSEAQALCRIELRLRSLELKELNAQTPIKLIPDRVSAIYKEYIERIKMSTKLKLSGDELAELSATYRGTYYAWKDGVDIAGQMTTSTFYTHRKKLLALGIDISTPFIQDTRAQIIPLSRTVEAKAYEIPLFAHQNNLVFDRKRKIKPMLKIA